jgi:alpha-glucuronidase
MRAFLSRRGGVALRAVLLMMPLLVLLDGPARCADTSGGLVGRWDFDDGTGRDLSGRGHPALLGGTGIHPLGAGHACIEVAPGVEPLRIPATADSPLALEHGTVCLWLNVAWEDDANVLEYSNGAVEFRIYRRHFQPRFKGQDGFRYSSGVLDANWPRYDLREWAFYPHVRAAVGDSEWHHFAVAYDDQGRRIVGWRDGEPIAVVDLSGVAMRPLLRAGLKGIVTGDKFVGLVDDIRIYNRVLGDADVRAIFDATQSVYAGRSDTIASDRRMTVYRYREEDRSLYRAWLQYHPPAQRQGEELFQHIVAEGTDTTVQTAARELAAAVQAMYGREPVIAGVPIPGPKVVLGTPATSDWVQRRADRLGLARIERDGFILKTLREDDDTALVVAGRVPAGVIFGVFDLIRRVQCGQDPRGLDVVDNPRIGIRMVDHWSFFRGFAHDNWRKGSRDNSIYSWQELRTGDTQRIRDWARLLASAGWNAICPSEVNWDYRDNFLEHLDEVVTLAGILRNYGIRLYWSPSYLLALEQETADRLYARVPDFGGYVLKLGSEKQNGDPRPTMVNRIADTLRPHGGYALVRAFVYGNGRYGSVEYRNLIPYDVFAPEDGRYRDNVVIVPKASPLDWDFSAPIPALDGAIRQNLSGSEMVIDKDWPVCWIEKWKWWFEQDNYRQGPGTRNKLDVDCILGVSMISPSPAWTACPLNMVNYYGLGRLAWNPGLSVPEIYTEWIRQTFGDDPDVLATVSTILRMSDDATRKLCLYRGYRGVWIDARDTEDLVADKSTHTITPRGMGIASGELRRRVLDQYAPGLRAIYADPVRSEEFLPYFNFVSLDYRLSCGRTLCQDFYANLDEGVCLARQMPELWSRLQGRVDDRRFQYTRDSLTRFIRTAQEQRDEMVRSFAAVTGRRYEETMAAPDSSHRPAEQSSPVRDAGVPAVSPGWDARALPQVDTRSGPKP